ncbi:MarR family transcriptional regulator [Tistrella mobilis]|uniref:MarR family transcriptional regulator n=1 Tax=Tistrella mobilis TaxID=171437 RepID=A0A161R345_9PROT|nr:MarR family transcriptional regulator [Tistrella mobilis]
MVSSDPRRPGHGVRPAAEVYERAMAGADFPLFESIGYLVRDAHRAYLRAMQMRVADTEVTMGMWFFLRILWQEEGITQRDLSRRIRMMEPTTVTALRLMERRGLVRRERDVHDRRRSLVYLTDRGRALRHELLPCAAETNIAAIDGLASCEIDALRELLVRVIANLDRDIAERGADPEAVEDEIADRGS